MLFVLNRLPSDRSEAASLLNDFARRLHDNGLLLEPDPAMVFGVNEAVGDRWHGGLDPGAVGALRNELGAVSNTDYRDTLVSMTAYTAGRNVVDRCRVITDEFNDVAVITKELDDSVAAAYNNQVAEITRMVANGSLHDMARHKTWSEAAVDLTAIVTRRAGVAAQETATEWLENDTGASLLEGKGTTLWRHTEDTSWDVQGRLEDWREVLAEVAAHNSKTGSLRPRVALRLAAKAWRAVIDPTQPPPRAVRRKFKRNLAGFIEDAQNSLTSVIRDALEFDANRFRERLDNHEEAAIRLERELTVISALLEGDTQAQLESVPDREDSGPDDLAPEPSEPAMTTSEVGPDLADAELSEADEDGADA